MPPPLILSTLPPPLNTQPWPIEASCLLAPLLPFVSRSPAGCRIACCRVFSASRHLSSRSRHTHPSLTPPLCSRQLVVVSHLFAPPLPLDVPPPHDWLCHCRRRCTGIFAVIAIAIVTLVTSCRAGVIALVVVIVDVRRHRCCSRLVSRHAVAMIIVVVDAARCAVTIIVDFTVRRTVAIVVVASPTSSSPVAPSPICEGCKKVT
jgi:hypothetical protein